MADCKACRNYGKRCVPAANGKCDHFEPAIRCMVCGAIIPEGRHICLSCEGQEIPRTVPRIRTNGDKIRAMSNEEIAELFDNIGSCGSCDFCEYNDPYSYICGRKNSECAVGIMKWLEREVEKSWP